MDRASSTFFVNAAVNISFRDIRILPVGSLLHEKDEQWQVVVEGPPALNENKF